MGREFGMDKSTRLYLKRITNKDVSYSALNSAQCYVGARMGGETGGERVHACMAESLQCSSETITTLFTAIPQYKIKSLKNKK